MSAPGLTVRGAPGGATLAVLLSASAASAQVSPVYVADANGFVLKIAR